MLAMPPSSSPLAINYIEWVVSDLPSTNAFYASAFGWTFTDYGPAYAEFSDGVLKGGFTTLGEVRAGGGALVILYADDLPGVQARIESSGGRITKPIYTFPGGQRFHFSDPNGYELAVWSE